MSSVIVTVLPTPAPPKRPTLPPRTYGAMRSTTLMPVSKISIFADSSPNSGGSRWIGQRSPVAASLPSTGSPMTFQMRPSVWSPTGTEIEVPVSVTSVPRERPSVESMATARTRSSPRCCCTSAISSPRSVWMLSAELISGSRLGNTASRTTPLISTMLPLFRFALLLPFGSAMSLLSCVSAWADFGVRNLADDRAALVGVLPGAFGEIAIEPCGRAVRPRCRVLGRTDSTAIGAACVLASRAPIAPARRAPFRQRPLDGLGLLEPRARQDRRPQCCDAKHLHRGAQRRGRRCRGLARRQGAGQAAERCRDRNRGCSGAELDCPPCRRAARGRHDVGRRLLERCPAELLGQRREVLRKRGAVGAAPDVRAQLCLSELRQFPVDAERGPGSGALALRG